MTESYTGTLTIVEMLHEMRNEYLPLIEYAVSHRIVKRKPEGPSGSGPLHAPIPIDVEAMDLRDRMLITLENFDRGYTDWISDVSYLYLRVRDFLGYARIVKLIETSCHVCGGQLVTAEDASTDVMCIAEGCGNVYAQSDWIEILYANTDAT